MLQMVQSLFKMKNKLIFSEKEHPPPPISNGCLIVCKNYRKG